MEMINTSSNWGSDNIEMYVPFYEPNSVHFIDNYHNHNAIPKNCALIYYTTISVSLS